MSSFVRNAIRSENIEKSKEIGVRACWFLVGSGAGPGESDG